MKSNFSADRSLVLDNLQVLRTRVNSCVDEGMIDEGAHDYNELYEIIEEAHICKTYAELREVIDRARGLEIALDAWLVRQGRTTVSLPWPKLPLFNA